MKKIIQKVIILTMCLCMCTGCAQLRNKIAYTIYPVGYLIQRITNNTMQYQSIQEADTIVQRANIADDYKDILSSSKVLFHIGTLEPYYNVFSKEIKEAVPKDIDLGSKNAIYNFNRYTYVEDEQGKGTYLESPYYDDKAFAIGDYYQKDLNLWLDPIMMLSMAKDILNWIKQDDPDHIPLYEENYAKLESELIELDSQYQTLSSTMSENNQHIAFVSMTPSFGNWQKTYGIQVYPVILSRYGILPNESQLKKIKQRIIQDDVRYIVHEPNMTEEMEMLYQTLEEDLQLTRVELSNLSSLSETESAQGKDYISIMYENLNALSTMVIDNEKPEESENVE